MLIVALLGLFQAASCYRLDSEKLPGLARGRVETCGGWQLSVLPEVKAFVNEDLPLYHNLVLKFIPGAKPVLLLFDHNLEELDIHNLALTYFPGVDPELILLNYAYQELHRINLMPMTRSEINELLQELGFYKKESANAPVPPEFLHAPMVGRPDSQPAAGPVEEVVTEKQDNADEMKQDL